MRNNIILISLLIIFTFSSCENMVTDVDAPVSAPKLVVSGFITPGLPDIKIRVYKSRPLYTPTQNTGEYPALETALVNLSDGTTSVTLPFDPQLKCYRISQDELKIEKGKTYFLTVTNNGETVNAQATVPDLTPPDLEVTSLDTITGDWEQTMYRAHLRFRDLAGKGNFYSITSSFIYYIEGENQPYIYETGFSRGEPYMSDINNEGEYFAFTTDDIFMPYPDSELRLVFTLAVTDENYYHFHKAIRNFDDDNPFAEPSPIYSNVNGGLGVFAAYVQEVIVKDY